jgi:hypothetical protein
MQQLGGMGAAASGGSTAACPASTPRAPALMEADETLLTAKISSVGLHPDDDEVRVQRACLYVCVGVFRIFRQMPC